MASSAPRVIDAPATAAFLLRCSRTPGRFFYPCNAKVRALRQCTYRFRTSRQSSPIEVFVAECEYVAGGTGWRVWPCALLLACWLAANYQELDMHRASVIELGSGLGLPGLTAAALGACRVRITDCLPRLLATVRQSAQLFMVVEGASRESESIDTAGTVTAGDAHNATSLRAKDVQVALLDWDDVMAPEEGEIFSTEQSVKEKQQIEVAASDGLLETPGLPEEEQFSLLLASDVIYSSSHARQLPAVLAARAKTTGALACIMLPVRSYGNTRLFLASLLEYGFTVRIVRVTTCWVESVVCTQMDEAQPDANSMWTMHTARNGRTFYHCAKTNKSVWQRPIEMDVKAPQRSTTKPITRAHERYTPSTKLSEGEILFVEATKHGASIT
eukprot:scaffold2078_cov34-Tisochrysis_lutea.AAC.1